MPLLTIILPVYNVANFLNKCLYSIEPLLSEKVELIIVNDGSTDNSLSLCLDFKECFNNKNITIITQSNKGLSGARNTGLRKASGKYIWFIDSDDCIITKKATELINNLEEMDSDIVCFGRVNEFGDSRSFFLPYAGLENGMSGIEYFNEAILKLQYRTNVWDKIYRSEFINSLNLSFVEGLNYEDMYFNLIAFVNAKKVQVFQEYIYEYNCINTGSITSVYREKDLDVLQFSKLAQLYVEGNKEFPIFKTAYYVMMFSWIGSCIVNKYSSVIKISDDQKRMLTTTLNDPIFQNAADYCAKTNDYIPLRIKFFARLLRVNKGLYSRMVALALRIRKL